MAKIIAVGPAAVPGLINLLEDTRPGYQAGAIMALGKLGKDALPAVEHLKKLYPYVDKSIQKIIINSLNQIEKP